MRTKESKAKEEPNWVDDPKRSRYIVWRQGHSQKKTTVAYSPSNKECRRRAAKSLASFVNGMPAQAFVVACRQWHAKNRASYRL